MFELILNFFSTKPIMLDQVIVPWVQQFIEGNILTIAVVWAVLKYIAIITPWAADDKILQIFTGLVKAAKDAVTLRRNGKNGEVKT